MTSGPAPAERPVGSGTGPVGAAPAGDLRPNAPDAAAPAAGRAASAIATAPPAGRPEASERRVGLIGVGVQKAATSWLFRCLLEHPEIAGAELEDASDKELNFFNHFYQRGYCWYHRGFRDGPARWAEFSVLYFPDADVPGRIRRYNPEARLLLSLRHPVDRAYSQHRMEVRKNRLPEAFHRFGDALRQNPSYVEQGRYGAHLARWLEHFRRDRIHVVTYDEICAAPAEVMRGVFAFAGVDPAFRPTTTERVVFGSHGRRFPSMPRVMRHTSRALRSRFGEAPVRAVRATGLPRLLRRHNRVPRESERVPPLTAAERAALSEMFRPDIERLEGLLDRDFSHWK